MPANPTTIERVTARDVVEQDRMFDNLSINTIRTLAMDAVQHANSGHPGTPMALAAGGLRALAGRHQKVPAARQQVCRPSYAVLGAVRAAAAGLSRQRASARGRNGVSVEAAAVTGWDRNVGAEGARIGMMTFGASAPRNDLFARFGFTPAKVIEAAKQQIAKHQEKISI
jgi:transketolase